MASQDQQVTPLAAGRISPVFPLALILTLGSLWGLSFSFSKMAINGEDHRVAHTFWQGLLAGLAVLAVCRLRRLRVPLGRGGADLRRPGAGQS